MAHLNIGVFGPEKNAREGIARELAKKGSDDALSFYNGVFQGKIITAMEPSSYPEKPKEMLFAAYASDYCILSAEKMDWTLGETIIALDLLEKREGCIISESSLAPILKGTSLEKWDNFASIEEAREKILSFEPKRNADAKAFGAIDHSFTVKSVGHVILGILLEGKAKVHDNFRVFPPKKSFGIKSIQEQGKSVQEVEAGSRFGFNMKNLEAQEVERGDFFSAEEMEVEKEFASSVLAGKHSGGISDSKRYHLVLGMQFVECSVKGNIASGEERPARISCASPVAFRNGMIGALLDLNAAEGKPRVVGRAKV